MKPLRFLATAAVIAFALLLCVPLFWMVKGSFTIALDTVRIPPELIPSHPTLANYAKVFRLNPIAQWTLNSAIIAASVVTLGTLVNAGAGYGLSRDRVPGRRVIFWVMLATVMIPGQVTLIPSLILVRALRLYNTLAVMIVPALLSPIFVFFYRAYLKGLPKEYLDAAVMDGAGEGRRFFGVVVPLSAPALAVIALSMFTSTWSAYFWQLISVNKEELRTIPVGIALMAIGWKSYAETVFVDYGALMAGAVYAFVPMLVVFVAAQRYFIEGIYGAGIRG